jgi:hypothetical protein
MARKKKGPGSRSRGARAKDSVISDATASKQSQNEQGKTTHPARTLLKGDDPTELRLALKRAGYAPIPLNGKAPTLPGWPQMLDVPDATIRNWANGDGNTGLLAKFTPGLDVDIRHTEAALAIEAKVRERFGSHGLVLVRIGDAPKRLIPFRTDAPFEKITRPLIAPWETDPKRREQRLEWLADGQQFVAAGIHPDVHGPYTWTPPLWTPEQTVSHEALPPITRAEAIELIDEYADFLVATYGYQVRAGLAGNGAAEHVSGEELTAPAYMVAGAVALIPNPDLPEEDWIKIGLAICAATSGSDVGKAIFTEWSARAAKNVPKTTAKRWRGFLRSPPDRIGYGTLQHHASQACPNWEDEWAFNTEGAIHKQAWEFSLACGVATVHEGVGEEYPEETARKLQFMNDGRGPSTDDDTDDVEVKKGLEPDSGSQTTDTKTDVEDEEPQTAATVTTTGIVPVDLFAKFDPPALPRGVLPAIIEDWALEQGGLMGADPAGLAAAALAVCAAAIPDQIQVKPKQHDNWREAARVWTALVGLPSTMKTPIISRAVVPLFRIDAEMARRNAVARAQYESLDRETRRQTVEPKYPRLRIEDITVEAAQEVLKDSPAGVLCPRDELGGWFGSMDKYAGHRGGMTDRAFWLQAYNGGSYAYGRVSRGSGVIENLGVTILGGIQPDLMRGVAAHTIDDGLLQRLCPIMLRPAVKGNDAPAGAVDDRYQTLVQRLQQTELGMLEYYLLEAGARAIRQELEQKHLDLMVSLESINKKLAAHIGKYNGIFARHCLLWHMIENGSGDITEAAARRVADWLHKFLLPHAITFYVDTLGLADNNERLIAVAGYILAHKSEVLTSRVIQRGDRTMRGLEPQEIEKVTRQLHALGWLLFSRAGRRPSDPPLWEVNPNCHTLFAARAAEEKARRDRVQAIILEAVQRR